MEASGHSRRRRGDGCTVVECYTPRRVVGRWLSGLKSSKGKRDVGEEQEDDTRGYKLAPIRCSTKRLNQITEPETNRFGEKFVYFPFFRLYFSGNVLITKNIHP